ncbi:MAG: DNA polymerase III subunit gamma/tau [bacterium]
MGHKVIARKWRPSRFEEVIGQEHITQTLRYALKTGHTAPVYLFTGIRGTGKTTLARILVKSLNCLEPEDGEPCGKCESCLEISAGKCPDIMEIDGASNNSVDDVRAIKENIIYTPVKSRYKVYIVDEVHMLSKSAFNALLKTLEEPPPHALFILATTDPQKIPATVLSRCQRYDLKRISIADVVKHLEMILEKEDIKYEKSALHMIAAQGEGSMRDSQTILEQLINFGSRKISEKEVGVVLGNTDREIIRSLIKAVACHKKDEALKIVHDIYFQGGAVERAALDMLRSVHNLVLYSSLKNDSFLDVPEDEKKWIKETSSIASSQDWMRLFRFFSNEYTGIKDSDFSMMLFEAAVLMACDFPEMSDFRKMISLVKKEENVGKNVSDVTEKKENSFVASENPSEKQEKNSESTTEMKKAYETPSSWEDFVSWLKETDIKLYGPTHNIPYSEENGKIILRPAASFESIEKGLSNLIRDKFNKFFKGHKELVIDAKSPNDGISVSEKEDIREAKRRNKIKNEIIESKTAEEMEQISFSMKKIVIDAKKEPLD